MDLNSEQVLEMKGRIGDQVQVFMSRRLFLLFLTVYYRKRLEIVQVSKQKVR